MTVFSEAGLASYIKSGKRLLGIDLGSKTIGLALSDTRWVIASPLKTLARTRLASDARVIENLVNEYEIIALVVGLPLNMDGSHGSRVQATKDYMRDLQKIVHCGIYYWDERLTTVMAERVLLQADLSRRKRGKIIDKMAATLILQGALDHLNYQINGKLDADPT